jgi:hypothetical protein
MKYWKLFVYFLLVFSLVHFARDLLQIFKVDTPLATILKTNHTFCRPFCDYVTLPPEIFIIITSLFALQKKRFGKLSWGATGVFVLWMGVYLWYLLTETIIK